MPAHTLPPAKPDRLPTHRSKYRPLLELLARTFGDDLAACAHCGGRMLLAAIVKDPESVARFLRGIGEPTEPPRLAPARGPPWFAVPGSRRATSAPPADLAPEPLDE